MTGFEPGSSGIISDRSANCATTTSQIILNLLCLIFVFVNGRILNKYLVTLFLTVLPGSDVPLVQVDVFVSKISTNLGSSLYPPTTITSKLSEFWNSLIFYLERAFLIVIHYQPATLPSDLCNQRQRGGKYRASFQQHFYPFQNKHEIHFHDNQIVTMCPLKIKIQQKP